MYKRYKCPECDTILKYSHLEEDKYICRRCNIVYSEEKLKKLIREWKEYKIKLARR